MVTLDGFPILIDLQQRSHVRSLHVALRRHGAPPDAVRELIVGQFDDALATARRRSGRSLLHFTDLAKELARLGVIDTGRVPSIPQAVDHRAIAEQKYADAIAQAAEAKTIQAESVIKG